MPELNSATLLSALAVLAPLTIAYVLTRLLLRFFAATLGWWLRRRTRKRLILLTERVEYEKTTHSQQQVEDDSEVIKIEQDEEWEKVERSRGPAKEDRLKDTFVDAEKKAAQVHQTQNKDWDGIVGFFHPFCAAGGGGERVLWEAVRTTQLTWPEALCVVYTGDHEVNKEQMLALVKERFNIRLYPPTVIFLYMTTRSWVLSSTWPHFTLLGQSIGSLILGYDAFSLLVPDIFIDTMGYAFTLALCKLLFPDVPTGAYVHYPTISTDMISSLEADASSGKGVNAGLGKGPFGSIKRYYWQKFAQLYGWAGAHVDVVMTNSTWTQQHIRQLWEPSRQARHQKHGVEVVYPPCPVEHLVQHITVNIERERRREPTLLYVAQFRPEKNHQLVLRAFAQSLGPRSARPDLRRSVSKSSPAPTRGTMAAPHLLVIGSVRDSLDERYVYSLRLLVRELQITDRVTFLINASYVDIIKHLRTASVGVNAMWNEHFGIGIVEYQAAGLICVVNESGGPKADIVIDTKEGPTGFLANTEREYALAFANALSLDTEEAVAMRLRARKNARRFGVAEFAEGWLRNVDRLITLRVGGSGDDKK